MKLFEHEYLLNTIRRTSKVISNSTRSEIARMMVTLTSVITVIMIMWLYASLYGKKDDK